MKNFKVFLDNTTIDYERKIKYGQLMYSIDIKEKTGETISLVFDENIFDMPKFEKGIPFKAVTQYKIEIPIDAIRDTLYFSVEVNGKYFVKTVFDYINKFIDMESLIRELEMFKCTKEGKKYEDRINAIINQIEGVDLENMIMESNKEFERIGQILLNSSLYEDLASSMSPLEVMKMITYQLYCPNPPKIDQDFFDEMVESAIKNKEDAPENIWRLGISYDGRGYDFDLLDSYFVKSENVYYLSEYISSVEQVDQQKLTDMILETGNRKFIKELLEDNFVQSHLEKKYYNLLKERLEKDC